MIEKKDAHNHTNKNASCPSSICRTSNREKRIKRIDLYTPPPLINPNKTLVSSNCSTTHYRTKINFCSSSKFLNAHKNKRIKRCQIYNQFLEFLLLTYTLETQNRASRPTQNPALQDETAPLGNSYTAGISEYSSTVTSSASSSGIIGEGGGGGGRGGGKSVPNRA